MAAKDTTQPPDAGDRAQDRAMNRALEETEIRPVPITRPDEVVTVSGAREYRLGAMLGQGGMGMVFAAEDLAFGRGVAIKVLRREHERDDEARTRFFHEARLLASMDHPGILPVYEIGDHPDLGPFYAMKRVRGKTLRAILDEGVALRQGNAAGRIWLLRTFEKICLTVAYAHSRGILHRDLKPANVMIDDFGVVLVMDWGLAKSDASYAEAEITATSLGVVKGTPAYMAPEQTEGDSDRLDPRTDVFALGVILYEILTGRLPFSGLSHREVFDEIQRRDPAAPRAVGQGVDKALDAICRKALAKDPGQRYETARELAEDIRAALDRAPTTAYDPPLHERMLRWMARNPTATGIAATVLLMLLTFGLWAEHRRRIAAIRREEAAARHEEWANRRRRALKEMVEQGVAEFRARSARIGALQSALEDAETDADTDQAKALRRRIAIARVALDDLYLDIHRGINSIMTEELLRSGGKPETAPPELRRWLRRQSMEHLTYQVLQGEWLRVHHTIWLYRGRLAWLGWTEAEQTMLEELQTRALAELRRAQGADYEPPDWDRFQSSLGREEDRAFREKFAHPEDLPMGPHDGPPPRRPPTPRPQASSTPAPPSPTAP